MRVPFHFMFFRSGILLFTLLLPPALRAVAQTYIVSGIVADAKDNRPLTGVNVLLTNKADTADKRGLASDVYGNFEFDNLPSGYYQLQFLYLGYKLASQTVHVAGNNVAVGRVKLIADATELKGVTIAGKQVRAEQKGDTSQFNADAFKTNPDASAEDLVGKMPGITSDQNGVKVNGEAVQQVLVDGKPFFGTDPTAALKNLPAEVIDKIQVFDRLSDQSNFTGFDDGNAQKTINIITKRDKNQGVFGKIYGAYGTNDRYLAGGNLNYFKGDRRISVLGLSNNINQQNFSSEDLVGASGGSGQNRGGRGGGNRGNRGGGGGNNFMVGQQGGIATTHALGLNYSDHWGKKIKVSGSYFFNNTDNTNATDLSRNYFSQGDSANVYTENTTSNAWNLNHRANLRLEYTIDSFNSITFVPSVSLQHNNTESRTQANTRIGGLLSSQTNNTNTALATGLNTNNNLTYQHKFAKDRRTISLNLANTQNYRDGSGGYYSRNDFYMPDTATLRDQQYTLESNSTQWSGNLTYTEPVGKDGQVSLSYNPAITENRSDKGTYNLDSASRDYTVQDAFFSNKYQNTYTVHKGGLSYRKGDRTNMFNAGLNVQYATLAGEQEFPLPYTVSRTFANLLPNAMYNHKAKDGRNLRLMYRTSTNVPAVSQLQNVVDITNPLLLKTGNAGLEQDYTHTFVVRYGLTNSKTARSLFVNLYANYVNNYIANATYIPTRDSTFTDPVTATSVLINRGSQLTRPVNLDGYVSLRSFLNYSMPVGLLKSNLNLNGGINYTRAPGLINSVTNYSSNYIPSAGLVLSSNISEKLDFALAYSGNYNIVNNTAQPQANNNFYSHLASFRINYLFLERFVANSSIAHNYYTSFSSTGAQSFYLWNAYVGYKLLKKQALEIRLTAYDLLKQNSSISRTVTETYVENGVTQVLQQYFMLQLTYTIRSFKGKAPDEAKNTNTERPRYGERVPRD